MASFPIFFPRNLPLWIFETTQISKHVFFSFQSFDKSSQLNFENFPSHFQNNDKPLVKSRINLPGISRTSCRIFKMVLRHSSRDPLEFKGNESADLEFSKGANLEQFSRRGLQFDRGCHGRAVTSVKRVAPFEFRTTGERGECAVAWTVEIGVYRIIHGLPDPGLRLRIATVINVSTVRYTERV